MTWTLFLDDEREFAETYTNYSSSKIVLVARSTKEAIALVEKYRRPDMILLDHDLGNGDTAMEFLKWLEPYCHAWIDDDDNPYPPDYRIHSANPVGQQNIVSFMESWKKSLE